MVALGRSAWAAAPSLSGSAAFERALRWREAAYEHGLGYAWRREGMWAASSFVGEAGAAQAVCGRCDGGPDALGRGGGLPGTLSCGGFCSVRSRFLAPSFTRAHWAATTTALALLYTLLRSWPLAQALVVLGVLSAWAVRQTLRPVFRVASSNRLWGLGLWALAWDALLCVVSASGFRSGFTVDSTYSLVIAGSNALVAIAAAAICLHAAVAQSRRGEGPCAARSGRVGEAGLRRWAAVPVPPGTAEAWPRGTVTPPRGGDEDDEGSEAMGTTHLVSLDHEGRALLDASARSGVWYASGPQRHDALEGTPGQHGGGTPAVGGVMGGSLIVSKPGPAAAPGSSTRLRRGAGGASSAGGGAGGASIGGGALAPLVESDGVEPDDDDYETGLQQVEEMESDEEDEDEQDEGAGSRGSGSGDIDVTDAAASAVGAPPAEDGGARGPYGLRGSASDGDLDRILASGRGRAERTLALAQGAAPSSLLVPSGPGTKTSDLASLARLERRWIAVIRQARRAATRARYAPSLVVDVAALQSVATAAHAELAAASAARHVLALPLAEAVEECSALARAAPHGSMLPWREGEADLDAARSRLAARPLDLSLAGRRSRVVLLKLLALSALMGRRRIRTLRFRPRDARGHAARRTPAELAAASVRGPGANDGAPSSRHARGRSFAAYSGDAETAAIDPASLAADDVLAMPPGRLLHTTAAATKRWRSRMKAAEALRVRAVLEACRTRWEQHLEAADAGPDAGNRAAERRLVAWHEAWEHANRALGTIPGRR